MKKKLCVSLIIVLIIFSFSFNVFASSLNDLTNKKNDLKIEKERTQEELNAIKATISKTMADLQELSEKIIKHETEAQRLKLEIETLKKNIGDADVELRRAQREYKNQKELLENRLIAVYESGETSYLDVLLKSQSLSDFISTYFLISEITSYDNNLLDIIEKDRKKIEGAKDALEIQQRRMQLLQEENNKNITMISNMQVLKNNYMSKLTEEEQALQNQINIYDSEMQQIASDILILINLDLEYIGGVMTWPVPGYKTITSPYGYRHHPILNVNRLHTGLDIGAPMWAAEVAANDGIVIQSTYNSSYGNMIMIDHGGGIVTMYGHGIERVASVGDHVKKGDVILKCGSTGMSTGPHLHFEVRVNGVCVDPLPYLGYTSINKEESN